MCLNEWYISLAVQCYRHKDMCIINYNNMYPHVHNGTRMIIQPHILVKRGLRRYTSVNTCVCECERACVPCPVCLHLLLYVCACPCPCIFMCVSVVVCVIIVMCIFLQVCNMHVVFKYVCVCECTYYCNRVVLV